MNKKPLFPVFLDLSEKKIVVIGSVQDPVCLVRKLAPYTKMVTLICPKDLPEMAGPEMPENIQVLRRNYVREDLYEADLVIAASSDSRENRDIHAQCKCLGIPVNIPGDRARSDFFLENDG